MYLTHSNCVATKMLYLKPETLLAGFFGLETYVTSQVILFTLEKPQAAKKERK